MEITWSSMSTISRENGIFYFVKSGTIHSRMSFANTVQLYFEVQISERGLKTIAIATSEKKVLSTIIKLTLNNTYQTHTRLVSVKHKLKIANPTTQFISIKWGEQYED